jgi:hypothetical protein
MKLALVIICACNLGIAALCDAQTKKDTDRRPSSCEAVMYWSVMALIGIPLVALGLILLFVGREQRRAPQ